MQRFQRAVFSVLCVLLTAAWFPRWIEGHGAEAFFRDDEVTQRAFADEVAAYIQRGPRITDFNTGDARFDGEWTFGTSQMAALGLAQVIHAHPALRSRYLPAIETAVAQLADPRTYVFAKAAWGNNPFEALNTDQGHAYLGYAALSMGALRELDPTTPFATTHDRVIEALIRRLSAEPNGALETYPGEVYPCDIASVVGAIAQHARITRTNQDALIARMAEIYRTKWIDPASGYLHQSVKADSGDPLGPPRGSGTALASYFWSFADPSISRALDRGLLGHGLTGLLGFGAIREYRAGDGGLGDIDSGPVIFGVSVSATGFSLAAARRAEDQEKFAMLYRTASLFGVPVSRGQGQRFMSGGPLGNAILLAMLTARRS